MSLLCPSCTVCGCVCLCNRLLCGPWLLSWGGEGGREKQGVSLWTLPPPLSSPPGGRGDSKAWKKTKKSQAEAVLPSMNLTCFPVAVLKVVPRWSWSCVVCLLCQLLSLQWDQVFSGVAVFKSLLVTFLTLDHHSCNHLNHLFLSCYIPGSGSYPDEGSYL